MEKKNSLLALMLLASFVSADTMGASHFGLSALIGGNDTMGTLTYQQPSSANPLYQSVNFNLGWFLIINGTTPTPSGLLIVYLPEAWQVTSYTPGTDVSVNYTSTFASLSGLNYSVTIYTENGSLVQSLAAPSNLSALWLNATPDGFYYAHVKACDVYSVCVENDSAVFGVYTPTVTVSFGASAPPDGTIVYTNSYTDYCAFSFYPARTSDLAGSYNYFILNGTVFKDVYTAAPGGSAPNMPVGFANMISGDFGRDCYAVNVYNTSVNTHASPLTIRFIVLPVAKDNTIMMFLIIAALILGIFITTTFSHIKIIGVVGGFVLLILGIWVATASIYFPIGQSGVAYQTVLTNSSIVANSTLSMTTDYQEIGVPSLAGVAGVKANNLLGLVLILLGVYAMIYYGMAVVYKQN